MAFPGISRQFNEKLLGIALLLTMMTRKDMGICTWNAECNAAFKKLQDAIVKASDFVAPYWSKEVQKQGDA